MNALQAIILGIVQGVAEFLPISSSGHLKICERLMGLQDVEANYTFFNVMLHFGTLIAVFIAYRRDIAELLTETGRMLHIVKTPRGEKANTPARRLIFLLLLSLLPLFLIIPVKSAVEKLGNGANGLVFIGAMLLVTGFLLYLSDRVSRGKKDEKTMTIPDALLVGLAQAVAVVPGLSRSGTTISVGTFCGLSRPYAVKFSFLMSIPTILAAVILELIDVFKVGLGDISVWLCLLGMVIAGVCGYFAINFLRKMAEKNQFGKFAYYCWGAALFALVISLIA